MRAGSLLSRGRSPDCEPLWEVEEDWEAESEHELGSKLELWLEFEVDVEVEGLTGGLTWMREIRRPEASVAEPQFDIVIM